MTYREEQRFDALWLILFLIGIGLVSFIPIWKLFYKQIIIGEPPGNGGLSDKGLILLFLGIIVVLIAIYGFIYVCKLTTYIDEKQIVYKFFPFHRKPLSIQWEEVTSAEVIEYHPMMEYGGWGLRYGAKGVAYSTRGNKGLEIKTKEGKNILIGTREPEELRRFLTNIQNLRG